ncbi:MAG: glycoside hydrolase family 97 protein [Sumerlaeia bacterium]
MRFSTSSGALALGALLLAGPALAQDSPAAHTVTSPGDIHTVTFTLRDGAPFYRVDRLGAPLILDSRLGLVLKDGPSMDADFTVADSSTRSFDETWTTVWGESDSIRNNYNELRVQLRSDTQPPRTLDIVFRAFDDGVGLRYEVPEQEGLGAFEIMDELTEFAMTGDHMAWWIGAYQDNRYEYLTNHTPVSEFETAITPLTMETDDGVAIAIHEAALLNYSSMTLRSTGNATLEADLIPWSDGVRVKTAAPMVTPWRTIQASDGPGGLIESDLVLNLNEPNKIEDTSWIEPGKYVGIWWEMHLGTSSWSIGETHGATTENTKRYIDFAAEHGFSGVLVEGWNKGWEQGWVGTGDHFSFTDPYPDFDLEYLAKYAVEKGTRLIGHHETGGGIENYERQMADAYALYNDLGVRAVKTGYVAFGPNLQRTGADGQKHGEWHHGQWMVEHYQRSVEEAAKHQVMVNIHEPIKDTGIRRTWPNLMTREGARGQEYNAWNEEGSNPPDHTVIVPFTRMLGGPFDYTPGIVELLLPARPNNRIQATLARELAHYVTIYSPLQMAADLPENYEAHPEPFAFIKAVPADWAETRVLHAEIGDYLTMVRKDRDSEDWYLGSTTDEHGRLLKAPLAFLTPGVTYTAQIYRDSADADWESNPYGFIVEEKTVTSADVLDLRLAPGGGQAIRFTPAE